MNYTLNIIGSIVVMVLIMARSPVQSMEKTSSHELAESGIMIHFGKIPDIVYMSQTAPRQLDGPRPGATPSEVRIRFELAESGQTIVFPIGDDPSKPAPDPIRPIGKSDRGRQRPWPVVLITLGILSKWRKAAKQSYSEMAAPHRQRPSI